jgi:hypothetical protein
MAAGVTATLYELADTAKVILDRQAAKDAA